MYVEEMKLDLPHLVVELVGGYGFFLILFDIWFVGIFHLTLWLVLNYVACLMVFILIVDIYLTSHDISIYC